MDASFGKQIPTGAFRLRFSIKGWSMSNRLQKTAGWLIALTVASAAGAVVWTKWIEPAATPPAKAQANQTREWRTAAPGIVEASVQEVKLAAAIPARIINIPVKAGDHVKEGDLLVQLDDREEAARVRMAEASIALRKVERDSAVRTDATDKRQAEDAVKKAETALKDRQADLDAVNGSPRNAPDRDEKLKAAQAAITATQDEVQKAKQALTDLTGPGAVTATSRADATLAVADAELALAQAALAKTRITAPFTGAVLKLLKTRGEIASPSVEDAILTFGDQSHLRVRAELSELDIGRVKVDDKVTVVSDAMSDRRLTGRVASLSTSLGARRIGASSTSGPLWPSVREIIIELDDTSSLIPGLHVDVFFGPDVS
jgi:multidrug resistance efflux pump